MRQLDEPAYLIRNSLQKVNNDTFQTLILVDKEQKITG